MTPAYELKHRTELETPLLLFECRLRNGSIERWATHDAIVEGKHYEGRVLRHNAFEMRLASDDGIDSASKMSITLANADSRYSQIERSISFKGAKLTIRFVFYSVIQGAPVSEPIAVFLGSANPPDEITERTVRLSFISRLSLQRTVLPQVRVQSRCPWMFPSTSAQRAEANDGGTEGMYSRFYACGYSADQENGCGTMADDEAYTSCGYTRQDCEARGMFSTDASAKVTARFGGFQFLPPSISVRTYGDRSSHVSEAFDGRSRANDAAPLIYGTAWYQAPIVFSRNDGNLTHCEVLLGSGPLEAVHTVVVNSIEIPLGVVGKDMGATGWYNIVSMGERNGGFNPSFTDKSGRVLGDPHGSMAILAVAVPNRVYDGEGLAKVEVLVDGLKLERFNTNGESTGIAFTRNPTWVLLDVLKRSGWRNEDLNLGSFAHCASSCDELIPAKDIHGNDIQAPKFECNLAVTQRRSAAELVRGIRTASALMLTFDGEGRLELRPECSLAEQHPDLLPWSNAIEMLDAGWLAYEFGDGHNGIGGILRDDSGRPLLRLWSKATGETPNRLSVEYQNAFNEYQQDSVSLADLDDVLATGQELSTTLPALGLPNTDQALRVLRFHLMKSQSGNLFVEFETSVRGLGLRPGDIIALTYLKEGFDRAPFRVLKLSPSENYETIRIVAQRHNDEWYALLSGADPESIDKQRQTGRYGRIPRPLAGKKINAEGEQEFDVEEITIPQSDGTFGIQFKVGFTPPALPATSGAGIPIVGLSPAVEHTGGSLKGGSTYYYAVSAVDESGSESDLSFTVRATIPAGTDTNKVRLQGIGSHASTGTLRVYRGETPNSLLMIAANAERSTTFEDAGLAAAPTPPPDPNYDHANFHWRNELMPEVDVTLADEASIASSVLSMTDNQYRGAAVRITAGKGVAQERLVLANDATTLMVTTPWNLVPDATSKFTIAEASWRFGAATRSNEAQFEVPNRSGAFVQINGRAANALDVETSAEISILHRHRIGGSGNIDVDVPPTPSFELNIKRRGHVELSGVDFTDLANTRTVSTGTLLLHYWDELQSGATYVLLTAVSDDDEWVALSGTEPVAVNDVVQAGTELMRVIEVALDNRYQVSRGVSGSNPVAHHAGTSVSRLSRHVTVAPFPLEFFGTPASEAYVHSVQLKDVRICAAEFFVTNMRGDSPTALVSYTELPEQGLRTLAGGQYSIQVLGEPALQEAVAPPVVVDETRSIGDITATLNEPPIGGSVVVRLRVDGATLCDVEVPAGSRTSEAVSGVTLPVLQAGSEILIDVTGVPRGEASHPGRNLTVTIRI